MLGENDLKIEELQKIKQENIDVIGLVSEMNKNLKKRLVIPVQENLAYFIGDIKNTNVCKVYLGEDYFMETTNYRAIKILNSRVERLDGLIEKLNNENGANTKSIDTELDKLKLVEDNTREIIEDISDDDYIKLKKKKIETEEMPDLDLIEKMNKISELRNKQNKDDGELVIRRKKKKDKIYMGLNTISEDITETKPSHFMMNEDEY
jgi:prefoldin subunit 5